MIVGQVDIDNERMEDTYKRMVDFITVLGYPDDSAMYCLGSRHRRSCDGGELERLKKDS